MARMASSQPARNSSDPLRGGVSDVLAHQQEPLITNGDIAAKEPAKEKPVSYMSLHNKSQLAILCIARMADPLAATSIQVRMPRPKPDQMLIHAASHICSTSSSTSTPLLPTLRSQRKLALSWAQRPQHKSARACCGVDSRTRNGGVGSRS
jgi:hypothetical protein